jgi:hypothetical protein
LEICRHSNFSLASVEGKVWWKPFLSLVKIPPVRFYFSVLNLWCESKEKFFGVGAAGGFMLLVLPEGLRGVGGSGQSVMVVL